MMCCIGVPPAAGDLLRDLDKELSDYSKRRQQKRAAAGRSGGGAAAGGPPKSLWEELADIGGETLDEFLDFLEQVGPCIKCLLDARCVQTFPLQ